MDAPKQTRAAARKPASSKQNQYPLYYIFQSINEIEHAFMYGQIGRKETLQRLYGVMIVLNNISQHTEPDEAMTFALERETTGVRNLIDMLETILGQQFTETVALPAAETKTAEIVKDWFNVECKCGANYVTKLPAHWKRIGCRECNKPVYADRQREKVNTDKGPAWVMTNCYYVNPPEAEDRDETESEGIEN